MEEMKEEIEILKLQLKAKSSEVEELRKELNEIHASISYRVGRWIAETRIGGWLKRILRKYFK
jgi:predicted RNase H-like nuclease (RuvC/YqgF family)